MNPLLNPYAPGAGTPPPELSGRDELLTKVSVALQRLASGHFGRSVILTGLRGVGKTVLLNRIRQDADAAQLITVRLEATEERSLPSLLAPALKSALLKISLGKAATDLVLRGFKTLASFVASTKLRYGDVELGLDFEPDKSFVASGSLEEDLTQLFQSVGLAVKEKKTAIVLFIDEIHVLNDKQLASLIKAFHIVAQDTLPITMVAAGLPEILAKMGEAKTYAERLFEFPRIGPLDYAAAIRALTIPAEKLGITYTEQALSSILDYTQGYAYFLQEWGKNVWDVADTSPIEKSDVDVATLHALADLDMSFFRVRFDQLTLKQKSYLRAMAELGAGPHGSGEIAVALGKKVTDVAPVRDQLINKGLIYSPSHGETAFTVPLFDAFMRRTMPMLPKI
jgi:Holliday junction resolvasome RuvABC ATP-dependent DNA helicase subunit